MHVQFYLTLLDTYLPDPDDRAAAFDAVENIPSIREKAQFCFRWMDSVEKIDRLETQADRRRFLLNLICFAACIEGLFFTAPSPTCTGSGPGACCTAWRPAPTGSSATRRCT